MKTKDINILSYSVGGTKQRYYFYSTEDIEFHTRKTGKLMTQFYYNYEVVSVQDLTELSEEEFFQESLVWKYEYCIFFLRALQKYIKTLPLRGVQDDFLIDYTLKY